MTVTAPPRPPSLEEPESFPDPAANPEALIEEAHERTRRRRRRYAALALALALVGVGAYLGLSGGGSESSANVGSPDPYADARREVERVRF